MPQPRKRDRGPAAKPPAEPSTNGNGADPGKASPFLVQLPGAGQLTLLSAEEVSWWNGNRDEYVRDYGLEKANDLMLLGALLTQGLIMFRAQNDLASDDKAKSQQAQGRIQKAAEEIRGIEKALGIDKKSREAGGQHNVKDYVATLKRAAHAKGIHISERTLAYEALAMEARWKIRVLRNGDAEDRRHHNISEETIISWLETELAGLEEKDKEWAREKGAVFVGKL